ncbi:hypothetical protein A9Q92_07685 [Methylophaga sp. 42_8_T64]|nr:hypothetical protein A9Q78_02320 [Methylophaga sp. 41_12_T18]OUR85666.1 hypothetical protein A9Q92_07685 [Methylophaga sp. 42_8_T64]
MKNLLYFFVIFISACSTNNQLHSAIQFPPEQDVTLAHVLLENSGHYVGQTVRWGGKIINVSNQQGELAVEVEQFPLNRYGFPLQKLGSNGRFIAQGITNITAETLQPGLFITFSAMIDSETTKTIKRKDTVLPILKVQQSHLWPYRIANGKAYPSTGQEYQHHYMHMPSNY